MSLTVRPVVPGRADDPVSPPIPTALPEVEVVPRWRDGIALAAGVLEGGDGPRLPAAGDVLGVDAAVLAALGVTASVGEVRAIPLPEDRPGWVFGAGSGKPRQWCSAMAALARAVQVRLAATHGASEPPEDLGDPLDSEYLQIGLPEQADAKVVRAATLGMTLGGYRLRVTGKPAEPRLRKVLLVAPDGADLAALRRAAQRAREWATATALARDLTDMPSNIKSPAWLAATGAALAKPLDGLSATLRDEKWLAKRSFGGLLAVGGGSASPPRLLELSWSPHAAEASPHVVLVGKGITFDTGGLSLKPNDGMHLMRTDMAGGAAVIAATLSIARLGLPVRVTTLVPAAENHLSGASYRPGDIVRHYGGTTTEVINTDAEGRMVLADAMAYAVDQYAPDLLVDVATLTGAMKVALGVRTGGIFASDDDLLRRLREAGERVGESWWPMPLVEDHADDVRSDIADVRQAPPGPGGITAALFLREFTSGRPWAHLDIAGPARADRTYAEVTPGATGFAARSLIELVASYAR